MIRSIHWISDIPTPYNACLFGALSRDSDIDLTVHYIRPGVITHPWQTEMTRDYPYRIYQRTIGIDFHLLRLAAKASDCFLVCGGWHEPTVQLLLSIWRGPFAIWTDTPNLAAPRLMAKAILRSTWLRWVFKRATVIMGTGKSALSALAEMGSPTGKLVNFPYSIDLNLYTPCHDVPDREHLVFVSCGRLHSLKGYDLALEALAKAYRGRTARFKYRIAGTGPEEERLSRQAQEIHIDENVELLGWLEPKELPTFYSTADVLLHPARIEPYGVAVLEAMASGLVVIGSDATAAVLDRIEPGYNGFIHRANSVDDLACQISFILDNAECINRIKIAARLTAEEWPVSRAVEIVKSVLSRTE